MKLIKWYSITNTYLSSAPPAQAHYLDAFVLTLLSINCVNFILSL